ncbi:MAG: cyanoexosortase B [Cyanobacteria bacterium P01_C01_bin.89]
MTAGQAYLNQDPKEDQRPFFAYAVGVLMAIIYVPLLWHWAQGWIFKNISLEHEYFSYAFIGIPYAAYAAWQNRKLWDSIADQIHFIGFFLLSLGCVLYLSGVSDLVNLSLPIVVAGMVGCWKGLPGLRLHVAPLMFLLLATPNELPYLISPYTLGLQRFIANVAGFVLNQFDLNVTVQGIYLFVNERTVEVAPHCAGLKMLITSLYVALMLLHLRRKLRSPFHFGLLMSGAVLISVAMNILRNTLLTLFHGMYWDGLFHFLHEGVGGDIYSALMLGAIIWWMQGVDRIVPLLRERY